MVVNDDQTNFFFDETLVIGTNFLEECFSKAGVVIKKTQGENS